MKILIAPHPGLKKVCRPFIFDSPHDQPQPLWLASQLQNVLSGAGGVGLAAPQVGIDLRVFVMRRGDRIVAVFNPEILAFGRGREFTNEGCLSFPNQFLRVGRWRWIRVRFQNALGVEAVQEFEGLDARCFQHEADHLDGKTFDQAAPPLAAALRMKEMAQRKGRR